MHRSPNRTPASTRAPGCSKQFSPMITSAPTNTCALITLPVPTFARSPTALNASICAPSTRAEDATCAIGDTVAKCGGAGNSRSSALANAACGAGCTMRVNAAMSASASRTISTLAALLVAATRCFSSEKKARSPAVARSRLATPVICAVSSPRHRTPNSRASALAVSGRCTRLPITDTRDLFVDERFQHAICDVNSIAGIHSLLQDQIKFF